MTKKQERFWVVILALAVLVPCAWAQQQKDPRLNPPVAPLPPVTADESSSKAPTGEPAAPAATIKPDQGPLSGGQPFTSGWSNSRSYLQANIRYTQVGDNTLVTPTSRDDWRSTGALFGELSLQRIWPRNQMILDYGSGGMLFSTATFDRSMFHKFSFQDQMSFRRITILLADTMIYLPESPFGAGGIGGIAGGYGGLGNGGFSLGGQTGGLSGFGGLPGGFGTGLTPGMMPNQTILTGTGNRVSNSVLGQMSVQLSPRSSITMSGAFGLLRFFDPGFIESNSYQFRAGYDYKINATDTLAFLYAPGLFRFRGVSQGSDNHSILALYGKQLTGRLALRIGGGPRYVLFHHPLTGSSSSISWTANASLLYQLRNLQLALSYIHAMSGGSGVVFGADSDRVEFSADHQLSRMWRLTVQGGYAYNRSLQQLNASTSDRIFHSWHGGFHAQRPLGRKASFFFTYAMNGQNANNPPGCIGITCGQLPVRHRFGIGFSWGFGPYNIE